jgi:hypothetical protein
MINAEEFVVYYSEEYTPQSLCCQEKRELVKKEQTMETTEFYEELMKLKRKDRDAYGRESRESDRAFAERLGMTNKVIIYYKRGAIPRAQTIKQIIEKGGYSLDDYYRLMAAAAGEGIKTPVSEKSVPVYAAKDFDLDGVKTGSVPLFEVTPSVLLNKTVSRRSLVGVQLPSNFTSCEPRVPRGSAVIYSNLPCEPKTEAFYVFSGPDGALVRKIVVSGRQMWWSENDLQDLVRIKMADFEASVLGQVFMMQSLEIPHNDDAEDHGID